MEIFNFIIYLVMGLILLHFTLYFCRIDIFELFTYSSNSSDTSDTNNSSNHINEYTHSQTKYGTTSTDICHNRILFKNKLEVIAEEEDTVQPSSSNADIEKGIAECNDNVNIDVNDNNHNNNIEDNIKDLQHTLEEMNIVESTT